MSPMPSSDSELTLPASDEPLPDEASPQPAGALAAHSRFVQRVRRRYADELGWLPEGLPTASSHSSRACKPPAGRSAPRCVSRASW
jgi:hypothetical protein